VPLLTTRFPVSLQHRSLIPPSRWPRARARASSSPAIRTVSRANFRGPLSNKLCTCRGKTESRVPRRRDGTLSLSLDDLRGARPSTRDRPRTVSPAVRPRVAGKSCAHRAGNRGATGSRQHLRRAILAIDSRGTIVPLQRARLRHP